MVRKCVIKFKEPREQPYTWMFRLCLSVMIISLNMIVSCIIQSMLAYILHLVKYNKFYSLCLSATTAKMVNRLFVWLCPN